MPTPPPEPRRRRRTLAVVAALVAVPVGTVAVSAGKATGAAPSGARLERISLSEHFRDGAFVNELSRRDGPYLKMASEFLFGGSEAREPTEALPVMMRGRAEVEAPERGLRVTWLGHSSLLVQLDGVTLLLDPVWGDRASPLTWAGPKRFHPPPLPLSELPQLDAVVISHDHYDHLDYPTVLALGDRVPRYIVPLGVGSHLEHWGVAPERIEERDW